MRLWPLTCSYLPHFPHSRNIQWVGSQRDRVDFSPKDVAKVSAFLKEEAAAGKVRQPRGSCVEG